MNPQDKVRVAAGETDSLPPAPASGLSHEEAVQKDRAYSPSSEQETDQKQGGELPATIDDDIDADDVNVLPGTGGPDDVGDVEVDPADIHIPGRAAE